MGKIKNICKKYKICYIHIPKCGGTSIENFFFKRDYQSEHLKIEKYYIYYNYFIFSIVRNPYTRIISIYNYYLHGGDQTEKYKKYNIKNISLNNFLDIYNSINLPHLRTQFSFLKNSDKINYIGKFENLNNDIEKICEKINYNYKLLPHLRRTKYNNYIITPKFINKVNLIYKIDFDNYNYKMIKIDKNINYDDFIKLLNYQKVKK